ncbi:hypothetical protein Hypma_013289 [Hypsizygus marmoreus]|uniref:Uncharacterized protein n=1 Tax=Hypsizygus marmoreus TaxID=39966 RepID=A0A369JIP4_HYPMA|nr:hypothetical protein Hypma_013289 [Hypsizygus marmoreus]
MPIDNVRRGCTVVGRCDSERAPPGLFVWPSRVTEYTKSRLASHFGNSLGRLQWPSLVLLRGICDVVIGDNDAASALCISPCIPLLVLCFFNSVLISLSPTLSLSHDPSRSTQFLFPPPSIRNNDSAMSHTKAQPSPPRTLPRLVPSTCPTDAPCTQTRRPPLQHGRVRSTEKAISSCKFYQIHAEHLLPPLKALQPPSNDPNDPENHQQQAQSLSERPARAIKPPRSTLRAHTPPIRAPTMAARLQSSAHTIRRAQLEWSANPKEQDSDNRTLCARSRRQRQHLKKARGGQANSRTAASSMLTRLRRHCTVRSLPHFHNHVLTTVLIPADDASLNGCGQNWMEQKGGEEERHAQGAQVVRAAVSPHSSADVAAADVQTTMNKEPQTTDLESPPAHPGPMTQRSL